MLGANSDTDLMSQTWEGAEDLISNTDIIALACGSTEQHSIHLPLAVDTLRGETLTRKLVEAAPEHDLTMAMAPTLPYGYSEHHMSFPGTLTLMDDTYRDVIIEIGESLKTHGANRFLLLNFHGGNREPLKLAADRLIRDHDLRTHVTDWTDFIRDELNEHFGDEWGHAGDHETSAMELFYPELVATDRKTTQTRRASYQTQRYGYFDELSKEGGLGDPTNADPEFFESLVPLATERILTALKEDIEQTTD